MNIRQFISRDYYNGLNEQEKEVYMNGIKDALTKNRSKMEELARTILESLFVGEFTLELAFVGMKYRNGYHRFQESDVVKLKAEYLNQLDPFVIKVLVEKDGDFVHVAYVEKDCSRALRRYRGFDQIPPVFVRNSYTCDTAYYRITFPAPPDPQQ